MKLRMIIAAITGVLASFAMPAPRDESVIRETVRIAAKPKRPASMPVQVATQDWPADPAIIAKMSADECGAALDGILRHCAIALPDGETLDAAIALALRLTYLSGEANAERNPFPGRNLPSWLLHGATRAFFTRAAPVPAGWMKAVAQSAAGREAMLRLTTEFALDSPDKAKSLATVCPAPWKPELHAKIREGLAVTDPVAAAREAWESAAPHSEDSRWAGAWRSMDLLFEGNVASRATPKDHRHEVLMISSQRGPVKETITAIALYGEGDAKDEDQQAMLANLLQRDAAATRAAVEATGDPILQKLLIKAEQWPAEDSPSPSSPREILAESKRQPGKVSPQCQREALRELAAFAPDEAVSALNGMGSHAANGTGAGCVVDGMAEADPGKAFAWAKASAPEAMTFAFNKWLNADGPAALQAVFTLPQDNQLREYVERVAREPEPAYPGYMLMSPPDAAAIRAAAKYVKLPESRSIVPYTPRSSSETSPLWSDGPLRMK